MKRLILIPLLALAACSTAQPKNLQPAADWLTKYYSASPVDGGWQFVQSEADTEKNKIVAVFDIADRQQALNTQPAAIKAVCPAPVEALWGLVPEGVTVQVQVEHNGTWQGQANCN